MYFKVSTSKGNRYLQIVESYRNEQGKPRQRLKASICNVSKCSDEEVLKLCQSFRWSLEADQIAFLDDLNAEESYDYGDVLPVVALWQQLQLDQILNRCISNHVKIDVAKASLIMVAKNFIVRWILKIFTSLKNFILKTTDVLATFRANRRYFLYFQESEIQNCQIRIITKDALN